MRKFFVYARNSSFARDCTHWVFARPTTILARPHSLVSTDFTVLEDITQMRTRRTPLLDILYLTPCGAHCASNDFLSFSLQVQITRQRQIDKDLKQTAVEMKAAQADKQVRLSLWVRADGYKAMYRTSAIIIWVQRYAYFSSSALVYSHIRSPIVIRNIASESLALSHSITCLRIP